MGAHPVDARDNTIEFKLPTFKCEFGTTFAYGTSIALTGASITCAVIAIAAAETAMVTAVAFLALSVVALGFAIGTVTAYASSKNAGDFKAIALGHCKFWTVFIGWEVAFMVIRIAVESIFRGK